MEATATGDVSRTEILVHNVCHKDLLLLASGDVVRPRFSSYQPIAAAALAALGEGAPELALSSGVALGMQLPRSAPLEVSSDCFHFRAPAGSSSGAPPPSARAVEATAVYFPLMSIILPQWLDLQEAGASSGGGPTRISSGGGSGRRTPTTSAGGESGAIGRVRRVVFLISGSTVPRESAAAAADNSTEATAQLLRRYICAQHPQLEVTLIHSPTDVLHYGDNVRFVNEELRPHAEQHRRAMAARWPDSWSRRFRIAVSLTDGAAARVSSINACLREFKPCFLHMWEVKRFWAEGVLSLDDVEFQSFDTIDASPPLALEQCEPDVRRLVREVLGAKQHFERVRDDEQRANELENFWLRKTKKVVLAVLMVRREGVTEPEYFRGMNVEVSMPTGTLCSERNAIGSALASDPSLRRQEFRMIGVLSVDLMAGGDAGGAAEAEAEADASRSPAKRLRLAQNEGADASAADSSSGGGGGSAMGEHLNPLKPCGACTEWIKKLAEVNPDFKVVTFDDPSCAQVYVRSIDD